MIFIVKLFYLMMTLLILSSCQTTNLNPISNLEKNLSQNVSLVSKSLKTLNPFKTKEQNVDQLVEENKYEDAKKIILSNKTYFSNKSINSQKKLVEYFWNKDYQKKYSDLLNKNKKFILNDPFDREKWYLASKFIDEIDQFKKNIKNDELFNHSKPGQYTEEKLENIIISIQNFYKSNFNNVLKKYTNKLIVENDFFKDYPWRTGLSELSSNIEFQERLFQKFQGLNVQDAAEFNQMVNEQYLSSNLKSKIDKLFVKKLRMNLLKDGFISFEEIKKNSKYLKGLYKTVNKNESFVKIGFVDTTSPEFKNRNRFDFEISMVNDLDLAFKDVTGDFLNNRIKNNLDFLFITNLTTAKVSRSFKDKATPVSQFIHSYRQEQNPKYVSAFTRYQTALSNFNSEQIRSNNTQCGGAGYGAAIACGIAQGLALRAARKRVENASNELGNTPQTLSLPNYQNYNYRLVDINSNKVASFEFILVNLHQKQVKKSYVDIKDNEKFTIIYDVHQKDPNKNDLISDYSNEQEVSSWEKESLQFKLSNLIESKNVKNIKNEKFVSISSILGSITSNKQKDKIKEVSKSNYKSKVIADPRFDSIVVIKAAGSLGTGFYVTPDIILTAYHVVEKSSLVQLSYFDERQSTGRVLDHDIRLDLALIKADQVGVPLEIYDGNVKLGSTVEAIGHPHQLAFTITRGIISALRKQPSVYTKKSAMVEFIQSDTPISPGNSGGPLLLGDKVVGMADFGNVKKYAQNLNFSVSFNEINKFLVKNGIK